MIINNPCSGRSANASRTSSSKPSRLRSLVRGSILAFVRMELISFEYRDVRKKRRTEAITAISSIGNSIPHKSFNTSLRFMHVIKYQSVSGMVVIFTK